MLQTTYKSLGVRLGNCDAEIQAITIRPNIARTHITYFIWLCEAHLCGEKN